MQLLCHQAASLAILAVFVIFFTVAIRLRGKHCKPTKTGFSACSESSLGAVILFGGAVALWVHSLCIDYDGKTVFIGFELIKLLTSAIGALYLKSGYEKYDEERYLTQQKQKPTEEA